MTQAKANTLMQTQAEGKTEDSGPKLPGHFEPTPAKSFTALIDVRGGLLGGNVNSYRPYLEAKWFKPANLGRTF
jgi:hypothetical protein